MPLERQESLHALHRAFTETKAFSDYRSTIHSSTLWTTPLHSSTPEKKDAHADDWKKLSIGPDVVEVESDFEGGTPITPGYGGMGFSPSPTRTPGGPFTMSSPVRTPNEGRYKIAVFDSGVGGLSVVKQIFSQMPYEEVVYFGDTKRCPYGERTFKEIQSFCKEIADYLMSLDRVKAIVIACNTATAAALDTLQAHVPIPVIGMIGPGATAAAGIVQPDEHIGIMATKCTISSKAYECALTKLRQDVNLAPHATPKLAPLIEHCEQIGEAEFGEILEQVTVFKQYDLSCLIMGCTHYPMIHEHIQKVVGPKVKLIDPAIATVMHLKQILNNAGQLHHEVAENPHHELYCSADEDHMARTASKWLHRYYKTHRFDVKLHEFVDPKVKLQKGPSPAQMEYANIQSVSSEVVPPLDNMGDKQPTAQYVEKKE